MNLTYPEHFLHDLDSMTRQGREERCDELIRWAKRYADGNANPKWVVGHMFELAHLAELSRDAISPGVEAIAAERRRQVDVEGWSPDHDDEHTKGEMARAAAAYARFSAWSDAKRSECLPEEPPLALCWPWDDEWWRPTNRRRDLVKAGALIAAEIDRLDRAETLKNEVDQLHRAGAFD
ncbi:MAG: hypothetical protein AAF479_07735 [Pseudomonadota bacterium]